MCASCSIYSANTKRKQNCIFNCITTWLSMWCKRRQKHLLRLWCGRIVQRICILCLYMFLIHIHRLHWNDNRLSKMRLQCDWHQMRRGNRSSRCRQVKSMECLSRNPVKHQQSMQMLYTCNHSRASRVCGIQNRFEPNSLCENLFADQSSSSGSTGRISESAIDMLAHLFPHSKRSVLELILRRCDLDLLKAIEQCRPTPSAFKPISTQVCLKFAFIHYLYEWKVFIYFLFLFNCIWQKSQSSSSSMEPRSITAAATAATTVVTATTSPSYCAPMLAAYPKWVFPMSIPFSMDPIAAHHSANSAFKCIFTNCPMCVYQIEKYWAQNPVRFSLCGWTK